MRLGLAGGLFPMDPESVTATLAQRLAGFGVEAVCTHFGAASEAAGKQKAIEARAALNDAGIDVVQAAGYNPNLIHPDPAERRLELRRLQDAFQAAGDLGAEMVLTACGSHHPDHFYGPAAENHLLETRCRLIASLREAALMAEAAGLPLALECHVLTTLDSPENVRDILEAVGSPWIRANFDPVNFVGDLGTAYRTRELILRAGAVLRPWLARSAHIKDVAVEPARFVVHVNEVPPGDGLLDFDALFEVCASLGESAALIVEHLDADQTESALDWLRERVEQSSLIEFSPPPRLELESK